MNIVSLQQDFGTLIHSSQLLEGYLSKIFDTIFLLFSC